MSYKSGFVSIVGRPNVGKSTLLNHILKTKLVITSPTAQTTRNTVQGVYTDDEAQIVFVDTPGIHKPQDGLGSFMNTTALNSIVGTDVILFIEPANERIGKGDRFIVERLKKAECPVYLVLNKADLLSKDELMDKLIEWNQMMDFKEIIPISALNGDNVDELIKTVKQDLPEGPAIYPEDTITDHPEQFIMAEFIREKILYFTHDEIPHDVAIEIEQWIEDENGIRTLVCTNEFCSAKKIKSFSHFVSRDAMNVDGLSEATLQKMIDVGLLNEIYDLFTLKDHKEEILELEGFGEKSYQNLINAINDSKQPALANFIYSLGIPNVGLSNAKLICKHFKEDFNAIREADAEDFIAIDQIGPMIAEAMVSYFHTPHNQKILEQLLQYVQFEKKEENKTEQILEGKTFVVTGSLDHFDNRKQLKEEIEQMGGKVTGSVSKKTDYLINNDKMSQSSKNKKAIELNIPILSEEDFLDLIGR